MFQYLRDFTKKVVKWDSRSFVTMNAAQYVDNSENLKDIKFVNVNKPSVQPHYALVKIHASSINPVDVKVFNGKKKGDWPMPLPFIPGYDLSGVIEFVADQESGFCAGDEVFSVNFGHESHGTLDHPIAGSFAEFISIPTSKLSRKPPDVSHETAAALALAGTTALEVLKVAEVSDGTKILILGASSAVGSLAIQLAKLKGTYVATTSSTRALSFSGQFGADRIINYNETKWWLENETNLSDFDVIFDTVGESGTWAKAQTAGLVKHGGKFITIASGEAGSVPTAHAPIFSYASRFTMSNDPSIQDELISLVREGKLIVPIDEVFPFTAQGVSDIFTKISTGKSLGKNVLKMI